MLLSFSRGSPSRCRCTLFWKCLVVAAHLTPQPGIPRKTPPDQQGRSDISSCMHAAASRCPALHSLFCPHDALDPFASAHGHHRAASRDQLLFRVLKEVDRLEVYVREPHTGWTGRRYEYIGQKKGKTRRREQLAPLALNAPLALVSSSSLPRNPVPQPPMTATAFWNNPRWNSSQKLPVKFANAFRRLGNT